MIVAVMLGAVAFFALFAREDPVCWARNPATGESFRLDADRFVHGASISMDSRDLPPGATEARCSSDSISTTEAIAGTAVVAAMLGSGVGAFETARATSQTSPHDGLARTRGSTPACRGPMECRANG